MIKARFIWILAFGTVTCQNPPALAAATNANTTTIVVNTDHVVGQIDEKLYGHFLEHIYHSCNGGLWGEVVWNRSFEEAAGRGGWVVTNGCLQGVARNEEAMVALGDPNWRDYEVTFAAQKLAGTGGLMIGVRGDRERFVLLLGAADKPSFQMELHTPVPRSREIRTRVLQTVPGDLETSRWYQVRIRCTGPQVQAWVEDQPLFNVTESSGPASGKLALGARNATVQFRDVKVVRSSDQQVLFRGTPSPVRHWQTVGRVDAVRDTDQPLNAKTSVRLHAALGGVGLSQEHFSIRKGDRLSGSLWLRGRASDGLQVRLLKGEKVLLTRSLPPPAPEWKEFPLELDIAESAMDATLQILTRGEAVVWVDQVSLMPGSARATGGYRPDLLEAVTALRPPLIRWPGGSFVKGYQWKNGIGPQHQRIGKGGWDDHDPLSLGIDEFLSLCRKLGAEPLIPVDVNAALEDPELLQDALEFIEYCNGPSDSKWGKVRAGNGHPAPYQVTYWEIGNENWGLGPTNYSKIVREFVPAMKKKDPALKIAICGSGSLAPGGGWGQSWNTAVISNCAAFADFISLHNYENAANFAEGPGRFQTFWRETEQCIRTSANPKLKLFISEWNARTTDWRGGLYAGGLLNAFEQDSELVAMATPALWLRHVSAPSWDNAFINFDHRTYFAAPNYVVMKLFRDHFAPDRIELTGDSGALSAVATKSVDGNHVFMKVVNPTEQAVAVVLQISGAFPPAGATLELVAPDDLAARNSLDAREVVKVVPARVELAGQTAHFTLPRWSVAVLDLAK